VYIKISEAVSGEEIYKAGRAGQGLHQDLFNFKIFLLTEGNTHYELQSHDARQNFIITI
jgi:hypothetical protein